jgi:hypothetical protein
MARNPVSVRDGLDSRLGWEWRRLAWWILRYLPRAFWSSFFDIVERPLMLRCFASL